MRLYHLSGANVPRAFACAGMYALACLFALGCRSDTVSAPARPVFWALTMNAHAVALTTTAPWNTIRLHATPITPNGTPIDAPSATYLAGDSTLTVTSDGLVTAHASTAGSVVIATLTIDNVTHVDTTVITTVDTSATPPTLATLSIRPADSTDSTKMAAGGFGANPVKEMTTIATDSRGMAIDSPFVIPYWYSSSDPTIATVDRRTGEVIGIRPGTIMITVETNAYGVARRDSIPFIIGDPLSVEIAMVKRVPTNDTAAILAFDPGTISAGVGVDVVFVNVTGLTGDVVFDNPSAALESTVYPTGSGNIDPFKPDLTDFISTLLTGQKHRRFLTAGTYKYHSQLYGTTGTLIIK